MTNFFSYLLEANLVLIVLYTGYFFVLRDKGAPSFNRLYLLLSMFAAFVIPLLQIPLQGAADVAAPLVWQPASQAWNYLPELVVYANKAEEGQAAGNSFSWWQLGGFIYFSGLLLCLALSARRIINLLKWLRNLPFRYAGDYSYQLAPTDGRFPTFSFLNYIFWDNTVPLSKEEAQQILRHEVGHVKQGHSYDILLVELLNSLFWPNPFMYFYRHSLRQVHEHLADRYALQEGEAQTYLQLMVKQTLRRANLPLVSTFFQHNTLNRIRMIQTKPSKPLLRAFFGLFLAATVFFVVACEKEDQTAMLEESSTTINSSQPEILSEDVFEVVEHQPAPVGGLENFYTFLSNELRYPEQARSKGIEGRVFVQFVVDRQGNVTEAKVAKGIGSGLDEEAIRVIQQTKWKPGRQGGKDVKVRMIMPISFSLKKAEQTKDFTETVEIPSEPGIPAEPATPTSEGLEIDQVFEVVEEQPTPRGGMEAFYKMVGKELRYPEQAKQEGIEGRVFVQFIVDEQGNVSDVKAVKGIGAGCDKEAVRVIEQSKWEPGTQKGRPVKVRMIMPVLFKLK